MRHTLKAVFDDRDKAQQALDALLGYGYSNADISLAAVPGTTASGDGDDEPAPMWRDRPGRSTGRLLARLFGHEDIGPAAAPGPSSPDSFILTLEASSSSEAERAASLIAGFIGTDSQDAGARLAVRQADTVHDSNRGHAAPGALQYRARNASHYFGTRDADDSCPIGTIFREPMLPVGYWPDTADGDTALPAMHAGAAGNTDDAHAAYRFGRDMHENDRYRNRSWIEADADLKLLWEARDPAGADWESARPAVRLGWDSTSPEIDDDSYRRSHWNTAYAGSASQARVDPAPGPDDDVLMPGAAWKRRHPGELPPWENFIDALRYGWDRIRIGHDLDEAGYRQHHALAYPGTRYDDLAPVYRYGNNVRRRSAFQGRSWDEVEGELRAEWEHGHREGKPATWDEMKAALRHGWSHART